MPVKSAPAARKATSPAAKKKAIEIIVKRGAMRRFHTLKRETAEMPVTITWDRRTADRRSPEARGAAGEERRGVERRKKPSFTWDLADFVVVTPTKRQKSSRKAPTGKS